MEQMNASLKYVILLFVTLLGCTDWDLERIDFPQISTGEAYNIEFLSASIDGEISGLTTGKAFDHGHVASRTNHNPSLEDHDVITHLGEHGNGKFTSQIVNLTFDSDYYVRAFGRFEGHQVYSDVIKFRTKNIRVSADTILGLPGPDVEIIGAVQGPSIVLSEEFILTLPVIDHGVVWSMTNDNPSTEGDQKISNGPLIEFGSFMVHLEGLPSSTNFYFKLFIELENGKVIYSPVHLFHTFPEPVGWIRKKDFPGSLRAAYYSFVQNNLVFIVAGENFIVTGENFSTRVFFNDIWVYNPESDTWTQMGSAPFSPRTGGHSYTVAGRTFVGGGIYWIPK